jgi:hypothetical protein
MSQILDIKQSPHILDFDGCPWHDGGWLLRCGWCQWQNTHFVRTEVYHDPDTTNLNDTRLRAVIQGPEFRLDSTDEGNPSPRRNGIRLLYRCEMCPGISALEIFEHKGDTIIRAGRVNTQTFEPRLR